MKRIKCGWKKLVIGFFVVSGVLVMSSCNNQICPAYAKSAKSTSVKNV